MLFVTSFINLNKNEIRPDHKNINFYIEKGRKLLSNPYSFIVFIDKHSYDLLDVKNDNVLFHIIELSDLPIFSKFNENTKLPYFRNIEKDTIYYLYIMCSKTFFMKKAIEIVKDETHFCWIDFGILHIIKEEYSLEKMNSYQSNKIRIPGPINPLETKFTLEYPLWAFCGGLFCGDKNSLITFSNEMEKIIDIFEKEKCLTWEVNIWFYIYKNNPDLFDWYYADHNITMLKNF